jgi:hypothetical protein
MLADRVGAVNLRPGWVATTWLVALSWLALVASAHHFQGSLLGERLRKVDLAWRFILVPGLIWDAVQGFRGTGHLLTPWLSAKVLVYSLCIVCGIGIRIFGKPLAATLRQIFTTGSTPELEGLLVKTQAKTRPMVLAIWGLLVVAAFLGIAKPG